MTNDILTLIQNGMSHFSKGQKLIANYIMNSYDKAAFMTGQQAGQDRKRQRIHGGSLCGGAGL